jgi:hypothetical protein
METAIPPIAVVVGGLTGGRRRGRILVVIIKPRLARGVAYSILLALIILRVSTTCPCIIKLSIPPVMSSYFTVVGTSSSLLSMLKRGRHIRIIYPPPLLS